MELTALDREPMKSFLRLQQLCDFRLNGRVLQPLDTDDALDQFSGARGGLLRVFAHILEALQKNQPRQACSKTAIAPGTATANALPAMRFRFIIAAVLLLGFVAHGA